MSFLARALSFVLLPSALAVERVSFKGSVNNQKVVKSDATATQGKSAKGATDTITLTLTSDHSYQHWGAFFGMIHDDSVGPLFIPNQPASEGLRVECETGSPDGLVAQFSGREGVSFASGTLGVLFPQSFEVLDLSDLPVPAGVGSLDIVLPAPESDQYITLVGMIAYSNDGCVILDKVQLQPGDVTTMINIDAGTEDNNEVCGATAGCNVLQLTQNTIPEGFLGGPACPCGVEGNVPGTDTEGEGFMSLHNGVGLRNNLLAPQDWRAPMVTVTVS